MVISESNKKKNCFLELNSNPDSFLLKHHKGELHLVLQLIQESQGTIEGWCFA